MGALDKSVGRHTEVLCLLDTTADRKSHSELQDVWGGWDLELDGVGLGLYVSDRVEALARFWGADLGVVLSIENCRTRQNFSLGYVCSL